MSFDDIKHQKTLLSIHRRNLGYNLERVTKLRENTPSYILGEIEDARAAIRSIKANLKTLGYLEEDLPIDTAETAATPQENTSTITLDTPTPKRSFFQRFRTSVVVIVGSFFFLLLGIVSNLFSNAIETDLQQLFGKHYNLALFSLMFICGIIAIGVDLYRNRAS